MEFDATVELTVPTPKMKLDVQILDMTAPIQTTCSTAPDKTKAAIAFQVHGLVTGFTTASQMAKMKAIVHRDTNILVRPVSIAMDSAWKYKKYATEQTTVQTTKTKRDANILARKNLNSIAKETETKIIEKHHFVYHKKMFATITWTVLLVSV